MDRIKKAWPILQLIQKYESLSAVKTQGVDTVYDVVWSGIKKQDRPKKLSNLTVERVLWWQDTIDALYQSEAAGAYQIMEDTLRTLNFNKDDKFDKATQDSLALQLLDRRGWKKLESGSITKQEFANNLAKEWASFPVQQDMQGANRWVIRGQSYYAGDGLNKARAIPEEVMKAIENSLAIKDNIELHIEALLKEYTNKLLEIIKNG